MKEKLRSELRLLRSSLDHAFAASKSSKIVAQVINSDAFLQSQKIAYYLAVNGEADPHGATLNNEPDKQFYLPVLAKDEAQGLMFAKVSEGIKFENNQFGIPEPLCNPMDLVNGEILDLVLVPLLGFDKNGNRLGMGGGFYDRCFAFKKKNVSRPILMGFAYDFQEVASLSAENWDVPLDFIATESRIIIPT